MPVSSLFAEALACHQAGRLDDAENLYHRILAADARHADSLHLMGVIAYQQGRHDTAAGLIRDSITINPKAASYHANLGLVLREQGRREEAAACQRRALRLMPDYPEAHSNLGLLLQELGRPDEAVTCYRRAIALRPDMPEAYNNLANALEEQEELEEAAAACRQALALKPDYAEAYNNLGIILARQGDMQDAVACYRQAMALNPGYAEVCNNLGHALKSLGRFEKAAAAHQKALQLGGDAAIAYHGLSACRTFTAADRPLIARMESALDAREGADIGRSLLHFALGKIFDDLGEHAQAIAHFDAGNRLERKKCRFDRAGFAALVDRLIESFPTSALQAENASASQLPILIVGLPRSGTTLTEQILASHPRVAAGGERSFWLQRSGIDQDAPLDGAAEQAAIRDYLDLLTRLGPQAARVTDKMPYNFANLGPVHRLFPKARIIHCRRNLRDTALSIYFSRFARPHDFAYDRGDILFYVQQYRRLMAHWRLVLPPEQYLELDYEELVGDQETVSRRLVAFCGLEWHEACLEFFRTERPIGTLSAWQARQPLYNSSVERWRRYEPWLGELEELPL